jgi:hypothetical protein
MSSCVGRVGTSLDSTGLFRTNSDQFGLFRTISPKYPDRLVNRLELELRGLDPDRYTPEDLLEDERTAFSEIDTEVTHSPLHQSNPAIPPGGRSWNGSEWHAT